MLSGSMGTLDENDRELLGFTGWGRLARDGVEVEDHVSSVGRI